MRARFTLPYGRSTVTVEADAELLQPASAAVPADESAVIRQALENPIGMQRLRDVVQPGERVVIIVNDITRLTRTDLMLPPLLAELAAIPDHDIEIVFALGIHRRQTEAEQRSIVGDVVFERFRCFDHDCHDDANLVTLGRTSFGNTVEINRRVREADRILLTGEIITHLIAGYSGGRKSLVPGCAGKRTTTFNHRMIFDPNCRPGLLDGNPAHEDLLEAARLAEPDFLLNVVLTPDGRLAAAVAGHFDAAHRHGCRAAEELQSVRIDQPYDLLIASAGGFPVDIDLRQAHKGLENACLALREGGTIVFFAECPDGAGIKSFEEFVYRYNGDVEMRAALEQDFVVGGHKAYWVTRLGRLYRVLLVSQLNPEFVRRCRYTPVTLEEAQGEIDRSSGRIGLLPHSAFTLPIIGVE